MRFIDLFSGIGGFTLGLERAGMTCVGHVEIGPFCQKVLRKHWPEVPLIADVKEVQGDEFGAVELICGGPPCQPVSIAGKRQGQSDDRWLWGEALRLVEVVRPSWCLFENPSGIVSLGLDRILADLEGFGYSTGTSEIPACAVDAPHIRQRVWIVAESVGHGRREVRARQPAASGQKSLAHAEGQRRQPGPADNGLDCQRVESRGGKPVQPPLGGEDVSDLAHAQGREAHSPERRLYAEPAHGGDLDDTGSQRTGFATETEPGRDGTENRVSRPSGKDGDLADPNGEHRRPGAEGKNGAQAGDSSRLDDTPEPRFPRAGESGPASETWDETRLPKSQRRSGVNNGWTDYEWIECTDGKARRVKPGVLLLAHRVPGRVARLRALGNAVVPQVVERIGKAMMEVERR